MIRMQMFDVIVSFLLNFGVQCRLMVVVVVQSFLVIKLEKIYKDLPWKAATDSFSFIYDVQV